MDVTRIKDAKPYEAAKHFAMTGLRLHGYDASPNENFWVGLSHFLPGGGAESSDSPIEKVYFVLSGEVTIITDQGETVLHALDSCRLAPSERREIINRSTLPASMLVIMPYPDRKA